MFGAETPALLWHSVCSARSIVSIGSQPRVHPLTIVIVEDDGELRDALRIFLERDGFRTIEFESATRAHDELDLPTFDAVILDKEMPGINGLDFLAYLHGRFPDVPVILMTAFGGAAVADAAFARGAARYIEKPFPMNGLVSAVRSVIDASQRDGKTASRERPQRSTGREARKATTEDEDA